MKEYECAVILAPNIASELLESSTKKYSEIITSNGGDLTKIDDWGKRSLAYEIEFHREGFYLFYRFKGSEAVLDELNRQLRIDENVLRHMIVRDKYLPPPPVRTDRGPETEAKPEEGR